MPEDNASINYPISRLLDEIKDSINRVERKMDDKARADDLRLRSLENDVQAAKAVADNNRWLIGVAFSTAGILNLIVTVALKFLVH